MPLEDIGAVEALFRSGPGSRTEAADHGTLVMRQGMSVLVVFPCEALEVIFTGDDGALLWSFRLVREHVGFEITEDTPAIRMGTPMAFSGFIVEFNVPCAGTRGGPF